VAAVIGPIFSVHDQNIEPAVSVGVEEGAARSQSLRQPFLSFTAGVVTKVNVRLVGYVRKPDRHVRGARRRRSAAH